MSATYFFLELAIVVYAIGFGWELWDLRRLVSRRYIAVAVALATFWFAVDQMALALGLWSFPNGGVLSAKFFELPLEEYLLFLLHTLLCALFIKQYGR